MIDRVVVRSVDIGCMIGCVIVCGGASETDLVDCRSVVGYIE